MIARRPKDRKRGQVIIVALVLSAILLIMTTTLIGYIISHARVGRYTLASVQAFHLAEAGIDKAINELNQNIAYTGETATPLGNGVLSIAIASLANNLKRISATAYVPNAVNPIATKTVKVTAGINSSIVSFRFGVQIGNGGVTMGNGSVIRGNLFSNGNVSGGGQVTGDATVASGTQSSADQQWSIQNSGFNFGNTSSRANAAQSFTTSVSATLNKVSLNLKKIGAPSDLTIKIVSDNGDKPSKTLLATGNIPAFSVTTSYSFVDSSFATSPALNAGQKYWIIAIASVNPSNYFIWGMDNADGYGEGTGKYSADWNAGNPVWNLVNGDLGFKTYMGGADTSLSGITVQGNALARTLANCTIGGNAFYQIMSGCSVAGTLNPNSQEASPVAMPISNAQIADWETLAENGGVIAGPYTLTGTQLLGPKKINGDLTVNGTLYLTGPVWVNGDITFANNSSLIVHASTGSSGAILVADATGNTATMGIVDLSNNMTISGNGNAGSYPMILSTNTSANAITIGNNATSVILYAPNGTVRVDNNATANQITAHALNLSNNTTVDYVNGLQSSSFSNGPGGSWTTVPGTYVIAR